MTLQLRDDSKFEGQKIALVLARFSSFLRFLGEKVFLQLFVCCRVNMAAFNSKRRLQKLLLVYLEKRRYDRWVREMQYASYYLFMTSNPS